MNERRTYAETPIRFSPDERRYQREVRERDAERRQAATFSLFLRDQHQDDGHNQPVRGCDFCARATATDAR